MTATPLLGKPIAERLLADVRARADVFQTRAGRPPSLAIVRLGDDPDAAVYTRSLLRACRNAGLRGQDAHLPDAISEAAAVRDVRQLADTPEIDALLLQTPLPPEVRRDALLDVLPPIKDVDGLTVENNGLLLLGRPRHVPATARALLLLAEASGIAPRGAEAVIVGRSNVVGLPTALLLLRAGATPTICHRGTADLAGTVRRGQIVIVAAGRPGLVTGAMVQPGAVVLDAGTTMTAEGLRGDVDAASVEAVAGALTPVPGGVGPVTTAVLLEQVVAAAEERAR